jgi:CDP-diacylglycerol--glycerol-3-phosphate 3-phosphatidyltransferase
MSEPDRGSGRLVNIPNALTLLRVIFAIVFFAFIVRSSRYEGETVSWCLLSALAIFLLAVFTDWLDGFIARKYNMETGRGRVADPFVDKLLVGGAFIMFALYFDGNPYLKGMDGKYPVNIAPWMVVVIVGREFLISALRGYAESKEIKFGANVWGKQKMVFQSAAVCAVLVQQALFDSVYVYAAIATALLWLAVGWTIMSGLTYVIRAGRVLRETA